MKRGKDDDKIMGPMFPRLHVNDTEKGGPRAPPRNKMALYEQLSIPTTQRFNPAGLPRNPSNSSSLVPAASPSQGNGPERNMSFPHSVPHHIPSRLTEKFHSRQSAGSTLTTPLPQVEQRKKTTDEDDFAVPVFERSGVDQSVSKPHNGIERGKFSSNTPPYPGHAVKFQNSYEKDPKKSSSKDLDSRQEARHRSDENPTTRVSSRNHLAKISTTSSSREKSHGALKEASGPPRQESGGLTESHFNRSKDNDASLLPGTKTISQSVDRRCGGGVESTRDINKGIVHQSRSGSQSREDHTCPNEPDINSGYRDARTSRSPQPGDGDKSDDVSETSMVDSISGLDISPDDVVGVIGQKRFWKARKAIVNQQRVFAVQVFELHRLIKVQQLIASSPNLLLEESAYLGTVSLEASPAKKFTPEYIVKPLPHIVKRKDDSEKPKLNLECSAENAVGGKVSLSSVKNGSQPSNYGSYLANPPAPSVSSDSRIAPWYFHQSPGQQWLIPVMSPSEGLVYKPYPGPGFMGAVCGGGCGPLGPTPLPGNLMHPGYGVPPHSHQGMPGAHPIGHGYFPPYGMPMMNQSVSGPAAEQKNQSAGHGSVGQFGHLSGGGANFNMQHESSCNVPNQKKAAVPQEMQSQASKDIDVHGSTASSPGERLGRRNPTGITSARQESEPQFSMASVPAERQETQPQFSTASILPETRQPQINPEQPTRVIRVVPHNPRSATESAARIFQSIQAERKQYDSI